MSEDHEHPFEEPGQTLRSLDPCIVIIFGATGDLTARKLVPALYNLKREGQLPTNFICCGFARREKTHEVFREEMKEAINANSRVKPIEETVWNSFKEQIFYHQSEFNDDNGYERFSSFLTDLDNRFGTKGNRIFYLAEKLLHLLSEGGEYLLVVADNPEASLLEYIGLGILVNSHDVFRSGASRDVLAGAG